MKIYTNKQAKFYTLYSDLLMLFPYEKSGYRNMRTWRAHVRKLARTALIVHREECALLAAQKVDGTLTVRMVLTNWADHNTVKGTGQPVGPDRKLFVDLAKMLAGLRSTVSFYKTGILVLR